MSEDAFLTPEEWMEQFLKAHHERTVSRRRALRHVIADTTVSPGGNGWRYNGSSSLVYVRRLLYELATMDQPMAAEEKPGKWKADISCCCDDPLCVYPGHLVIQSRRESVRERWERKRQAALQDPCRADAVAWLNQQQGLTEEEQRHFEQIISKVIVLTSGDPKSVWLFTGTMGSKEEEKGQPIICLLYGRSRRNEPARRYMYEVLESIKTGERVKVSDKEYVVTRSENPRDVNPNDDNFILKIRKQNTKTSILLPNKSRLQQLRRKVALQHAEES